MSERRSARSSSRVDGVTAGTSWYASVRRASTSSQKRSQKRVAGVLHLELVGPRSKRRAPPLEEHDPSAPLGRFDLARDGVLDELQ